MMTSAVRQHKELESANNNTDGEDFCPSEESISSPNSIIDQSMMQNNVIHLPCSPIGTKFIYQQGIHMPGSIDSASMPMSLIFNLALSHQLLARRCAEEGSESYETLLQKSKRFYQIAHKDSEKMFFSILLS